MQNVEKELPGLIRDLLQSPAHKQRQLIERHYTPDCRLTHALVVGENREEIVRIFQAWRFANRRLDVDVNEIVLGRGGRRAVCLLTQHVQPSRLWGILLRDSFRWEEVVVLDLVPEESPAASAQPGQQSSTAAASALSSATATADGQPGRAWRIARHDAIVKPSTLLRPLPLLGWAYESVGRRAAGLAISLSVVTARQLWRGAEAAWAGLWLAQGAPDAGPPPGRHNGPAVLVLDRHGNKVWVQASPGWKMVQHVTGFQHYTAPPLFGFSLPMHVLMYLRDGPGGTKLIGKQIDYHSFEGILYCTPGLGWLLQHGLRRFLSAWMIGGAQLAAGLVPPVEAWLGRTVGTARVEKWKASASRLWWRQAPPTAWRRVPAPYDPAL